MLTSPKRTASAANAPYDPSDLSDDNYSCYPKPWLFVAARGSVKEASDADAWEKTSVATDPNYPPLPVVPSMQKVLVYFCDTEEWVDVPITTSDDPSPTPSRDTAVATRGYRCEGQSDRVCDYASPPMLFAAMCCFP